MRVTPVPADSPSAMLSFSMRVTLVSMLKVEVQLKLRVVTGTPVTENSKPRLLRSPRLRIENM